MFALPEKVTGLDNPHIENAYIKRSYDKTMHANANILVLETFNYDGNPAMDDESYMDVLANVKALKRQASRKAGRIDHVQIRSTTVH